VKSNTDHDLELKTIEKIHKSEMAK